MTPKPKQAREIHFKTYLNPEPAIVYDMAKCTPDLYTIEQRWEFVEKSAYEQAIKDVEKYQEGEQFYRREWQSVCERFDYSQEQLVDSIDSLRILVKERDELKRQLEQKVSMDVVCLADSYQQTIDAIEKERDEWKEREILWTEMMGRQTAATEQALNEAKIRTMMYYTIVKERDEANEFYNAANKECQELSRELTEALAFCKAHQQQVMSSNETVAQYKRELAEARAQLEELKLQIPKVPTHPYEQELLDQIAEARAEVERLTTAYSGFDACVKLMEEEQAQLLSANKAMADALKEISMCPQGILEDPLPSKHEWSMAGLAEQTLAQNDRTMKEIDLKKELEL